MIEEIILKILAEKQEPQGCEKKFIIEQCQNRIPKGSGLSVNDKVINAHLRSLTTRGLIVCAKGHRGKCTWREFSRPQQLPQIEPQPEPDDDDDDRRRRSCTTATSCHKLPRKQKVLSFAPTLYHFTLNIPSLVLTLFESDEFYPCRNSSLHHLHLTHPTKTPKHECLWPANKQ